MSGFYYNENNFEYLYEEVSVLLSNTIMENDISKEWLCDLYKDDKYNVTRAIDMYNSDILINNITITTDLYMSGVPSGDKTVTILKNYNSNYSKIEVIAYKTAEDYKRRDEGTGVKIHPPDETGEK